MLGVSVRQKLNALKTFEILTKWLENQRKWAWHRNF